MRILTLLLFVVFTCVRLFSQIVNYDEVNFKKVLINQLPLGAEKSDVIKIFGRPIKIIKDVQEVIGESWLNYHYKKSIMVINPKTNHLRGFNILDSCFVLTCNSIVVKVGDSMNVLKKGFPRSLKTYKNQKDKYLRLKFKEGDGYILFTIKNDRIIQIQTWDDFY